MGKLIDGAWVADGSSEAKSPHARREFQRAKTRFRRFIEARPGAPFPPERGRYRLYVSRACPWAHRTLIVRQLKGLSDAIDVSVLDPFMGDDGWTFSDGPGCVRDPEGATHLRDVYLKADARYSGRVSVPVLWDTKTKTIVNNESGEIVHMLNSEFDALGADASVDLYPEPLRDEIDELNERVYGAVNNGVYRCGFAPSQYAYNKAFDELFVELDRLEERLTARRWLVGDRFTEADVRLFTTMVRFDPVYVTHFKCNKKRLADYPALLGHTREVYQLPGVGPTVAMDHIKEHYYRSHESISPRRIIAGGFELDLDAPHGRGGLR